MARAAVGHSPVIAMSEVAAPFPLGVPELLAPAGDWECARAAVENGADAIYFGLDRFNARMRARNFTVSDLPRLMEFLHGRGVRGYVTFNTLIFEEEMAQAEAQLRALISAGADAAIVQDVGLCRLIRQCSPDFPIHASTQMTITSAAGVEFARELGCSLVVLSRECSIPEIASIRSALSAPLPLEVFVHGALCVAYSGQCLTSESLGGRSANRGECAQACRMPYELVSDGASVELGGRRYLLSPQDLAGIDVLPELARAGVASLKIEGRLKSPEYVASVTRVYRAALDRLATGAPRPPEARPATERYELEMAFSRGLHTGWLGGNDNQRLVHGRFGKKRGVFLGEVLGVERGHVRVRLQSGLKAGDGVVFDAGRGDDHEEGGRVFGIRRLGKDGDAVMVAFLKGAVNFDCVHIGDKVWKTDDPELNRALRRTFEGDDPRFQRPLDWEAHGHAGSPLTLIARDGTGCVARSESADTLVAATRQPITTQRLHEQLGRLGGTPFRMGELVSRIEGAVMLPVSELNRMRREIVAQLMAQRAAPRRWTLLPRQTDASAREEADPNGTGRGEAELIVLVRSMAQLDAAMCCGIRTVYCEFEDPKRYRDAVQCWRGFSASAPMARSLWVAPPRIFKTGEEWVLRLVRSCDADGYLVRNPEHLRSFEGCRRIGDFSLNVANTLAAEHFITRWKLERVTASYDLNLAQIEALLRNSPPSWFEVVIHQHMPMFHMEHCVFCAFLSSGKDYRDCGRPCDKHSVTLRDRVGVEHPLKADAGCRNTVFNARAQTGAEFTARLIALGVRRFRVEFLNETGAETERILAKYRQLLRGEIMGDRLWRELKLHSQLGVTRGQMEKPDTAHTGR